MKAAGGNVQRDQQCVTSGTEFPYCKANAQRQPTTLKKLCLFSHHTKSSGHTKCSRQICRNFLPSRFAYFDYMQINAREVNVIFNPSDRYLTDNTLGKSPPPQCSSEYRGPRYVSQHSGERLIDKSIVMRSQQLWTLR